MCCTAAVAAEIPEILDRTAAAANILVLDGCDKACAKKILDDRGFTNYAYVELGSIGMEKRQKRPRTKKNVARAAAAACEALAR